MPLLWCTVLCYIHTLRVLTGLKASLARQLPRALDVQRRRTTAAGAEVTQKDGATMVPGQRAVSAWRAVATGSLPPGFAGPRTAPVQGRRFIYERQQPAVVMK